MQELFIDSVQGNLFQRVNSRDGSLALIVCDTDFLMRLTNEPLPKLDAQTIFSENTIATLPSVVRELRGLVLHPTRKTSRAAKNTLRLIEEKRGAIQVIREGKGTQEALETDIALVEFAASDPQVIIATLDGSLLARLERIHLPYLTLTRNKPLFRSFRRATYLTPRN